MMMWIFVAVFLIAGVGLVAGLAAVRAYYTRTLDEYDSVSDRLEALLDELDGDARWTDLGPGGQDGEGLFHESPSYRRPRGGND